MKGTAAERDVCPGSSVSRLQGKVPGCPDGVGAYMLQSRSTDPRSKFQIVVTLCSSQFTLSGVCHKPINLCF